MTLPRLPGRLLACLFLCLAASRADAVEIRIDPDPGWRQSTDMAELVEVLERWLDAQGVHARAPHPPRVELVDPATALELSGVPTRTGERNRGLYDARNRTIFLVRPWSPHRAEDVSVLLHELVHHRQADARHWVCAAAQEPEAYEVQEFWLALRGEALDYNRFAVIWEAGCSPRDVHPD